MTRVDLLAEAREILDRPAAATAGVWPRVVALLTRQAFEHALNEFWGASPTTAGLCQCTRKSQLACLPFYIDGRTAREMAYTWAVLSEACHYHAYELAPTAAELGRWMDAVARFTASTRRKVTGPDHA